MFQSSIAPKGNRYGAWKPRCFSPGRFQSSIAPKGNRYLPTTKGSNAIKSSNPRSPRRAIATRKLYGFESPKRSNPRSPRRAIATGDHHGRSDAYREFQSSIAPKGNRYTNKGDVAQWQRSSNPRSPRRAIATKYRCHSSTRNWRSNPRSPRRAIATAEGFRKRSLRCCSNPRSPRRAIATRQP